eukprot:CAMPEP_0181319832 /NCGR_PEP_ID=MMETSP1101-20121128/17788_1 /TAXON_ID=46948 /ORGANISM="Rhodomonas abbreviata, Strain Caron Lab Isolate" /LENGTH=237 /DNA_ID=CAMNT_0023427471 /DNA_START=134 /DNA_END=847 /DNA_ORIENTATION=-
MDSVSVVAEVVSSSLSTHHDNSEPYQMAATREPEAASLEADHDTEGDNAEHVVDDNVVVHIGGSEVPLSTASINPAPSVDPVEGKLYLSLDVGSILEKHRIMNEQALNFIDRSTHSVTAIMGGSHEECTICLEPMAEGHLVSSLPCKHTFHYECISQWLKEKLMTGRTGCCPMCNLQIIIPVMPPPCEEQPRAEPEGAVGENSCCGQPVGPRTRNLIALLFFIFVAALLGVLGFLLH